MKKFCSKSIESIVKCAIDLFINDLDAPDFVCFFWKGHYVKASFEWSPLRCAYFLSDFIVVYSRCIMRYKVNEDFALSIALCE